MTSMAKGDNGPPKEPMQGAVRPTKAVKPKKLQRFSTDMPGIGPRGGSFAKNKEI